MKLNSIQFLRAVAVLLVLFQHSLDTQMTYAVSWQQNFYHLYNFGCIGVDLFFVISGFIITYVTNDYIGVSDGVRFFRKRFIRINIMYYIATLLFLGVYCLQLRANIIPTSNAFNRTMSSLLDSALIIPTTKDTNNFLPLLNVGWTLAFEWLFYILFIFLIIFKAKRKTLLIPGLILTLILIGQILKSNDLRIRFLTNPIMLEFVLGVFLCHFYLRRKKIPTWVGVIFLAAGLINYIILIIFGFDKLWYFYGTINGQLSINRFLLWGIPSSCIVTGCVILEKNELLAGLWSNKFSLLVGNASYSIYLLHYTILNFLMVVYAKKGLFFSADVIVWFQIIVAVAISLVFYKFIEKPLLQYMNNSTLWDAILLKTNPNVDKPTPLIEQANTPIIR